MATIGELLSTSYGSSTAPCYLKPSKKTVDDLVVLKQRIGKIVVECMQAIAADHLRRMEGCFKQISLLNEGIFYQDGLCEVMIRLMQSRGVSQKAKQSLLAHFTKMQTDGNFYHGDATSHFTISADKNSPTGKATLKYCLKGPTVSPSEALEAIIQPKKRVFLSCGEVCLLSYMYALLNIFGKERFDFWFGFNSPTPLYIGAGGNSLDNPLYLFVIDRKPCAEKPLQQGEWVFFQGAKFPCPSTPSASINIYGMKHWLGSGGNWNTIFNPKEGEETYLGLGLKPTGVTATEIQKLLLTAYNNQPSSLQGLTDKVRTRLKSTKHGTVVKFAKFLKNHTLTPEKFRELDGGKAVFIRSLNISRIQALISATPEEGLILLARWKEQFFRDYKLRQA